MGHNEMYEAALKPPRTKLGQLLYSAWVFLGLAALVLLAWAEPFSARLFENLLSAGISPLLIKFVAVPAVMILRAVLLVESIGYAYHRFFQHVGVFTRLSIIFRKNQKFHWIHHMIIYPIGKMYRRRVAYVSSEKGVGWSWVLPGIIVAVLFTLTNGINMGTLVFIAALGLYAKYVVDLTHSRFHEINHPWAESNYFHWLEDIHVLHHWDQRKNFTIVHPLMDILFGTYLSPAAHREELRVALEDHELTVSDLINWRYLLVEATPVERAAFVSNARRVPRSIRKIGLLLKVLRDRVATHPEDAHARDLFGKAQALLMEVGKDPQQFLS